MLAYEVHVCKANSIHNSELGEEGVHTFSLAYYVKYHFQFMDAYGIFPGSYWMEMNGKFHATATLPLGKEPSVPFIQETWWALS